HVPARPSPTPLGITWCFRGTTSNVARQPMPNTNELTDQVGCVSALSGDGAVRVRRQIVPQRLASTVDPAADGPELHAERGAHLLVGQSLDVTQDHCRAELRRQRI